MEKTRILDEYVALAECHRKHAIRLLTTPDTVEPETTTEPSHGRRIYAEAVRAGEWSHNPDWSFWKGIC